MSKLSIEYYGKKFGSNVSNAFIHITREIGELARAIETDNRELAKLEITELVGLSFFLAEKYGFDLLSNVEAVYKKKLEIHKTRVL